MASYEQALRLFERWANETENITAPSEVREQTIRRYICDLQERGKYTFYSDTGQETTNCPTRRRDYRQPVSITTINNYLRNLRAFFNWYCQDSKDCDNPMRKIRLLVNERVPREYLKDTEIRKLFSSFDKSYFPEHRDSTVIMLILDTGMRLGECLSLTIHEIDLTERVIQIPAELTKGRKPRCVFFSGKTAKVLRQWLRFKDRYMETTALFPAKSTGQPVEIGTFETNFRNYLQRTGIQKKVSPPCPPQQFCKAVSACWNGHLHTEPDIGA